MGIKFYNSNCLIEALKAKIKDPRNVKIHIIPKGFNIDGGIHFIWENKSLDPNNEYYFEFCSKKRTHNNFFFKGTVSRTKRTEIHRMMNDVLARNKKLRKLEKEFDMKFNQGKAEDILNTIALYDWKRVDNVSIFLPDLKDAPKRLPFTPEYYNYDNLNLKWQIMSYNEKTGEYKIYDFDENGSLITNGDKIKWWKWELYKTPISHLNEWNKR